MQKTIFIASLLIFAALAFSNDDEISDLWKAWKALHNKGYTSDGEETARRAIFSDNYRKILKFNAENETPKLGLNQFADLTSEEFKNKHSRCAFVQDDDEFIDANTLEYEEEVGALPASVDWRTKGAVTPVKNQEQCGSCWAFSTTGVLEGFHAIKNGKLVSFSEQQVVDCDTIDYGCEGGWPYEGIEYAAKNGLETETEYPYKGVDEKCNFKKSEAITTNTGYTFVTAKNVNALKTAITTMPVSVAIEADQDVFQLYKSGVIKSGCGATLDHAVLIVGYTTVSGTEAFIVKNSWGTSWGDKGYVYISTDPKANSGAGVCGILSQPVVPK